MLKENALAAGVILLTRAADAAASSTLYPALNPASLAKAFNISIGCLAALNTTVSCDSSLLQMAGNVDNFLWDKDNVTALCTADCLSTASTWWTRVLGACANDYLNVRSRKVPPLTIPGRIVDGLNIACLTPKTNVASLPGINGSEITSSVVSVSNSTVTKDTTVPVATSLINLKRDFTQAFTDLTDFKQVGNISERQSSTASTGFCLLDSYAWTGSDIIRPDCSSSSTDRQCLDPTDVPEENQRIANLYPDSVLCSDCFLKMFYLRVASPYLPDLDYSDYLLVQYLDIVDVCKAKMPDLLVRTRPEYDYVKGTWDGAPQPNNTKSTATLACNQTLTMADLQKVAVPDPTANGTIFCDALSTKYNVTTGDLQTAFDAPFCTPGQNFTKVCLPAPCTVMSISYNATCTSVVQQLSTAGHNITATQLLLWNPNLRGLCDQLPTQYICISAPGGSYIPPPATNQSSGDAGHVRGGGTGDSTGDGSAAGGGRNATVVAIGSPAPSPTQSGISPLCTEYAMASPGDGCYSLTQLWRIPAANFYAWNSVLGVNGENCSIRLFANYYYCIDIVRNGATSTPTTGATPPGPTQSGIIGSCNKFAESIAGLGCADFAAKMGITPAQLYAWNPVLGASGENCASQFWANEYYCVGVSGPSATTTLGSTPSTTTSVVAPGPTQSGIINTCNKFAESITGLGCSDFATRMGISPAQLYAWNTILGPNGANCGSEFWANEYYCVGVTS